MTNKNEPIFKPIFGNDWESLPPVIKKHYINRPFSNDVVTVEGKMDVKFCWLVKILSPIFRILGTLVPYQGKDIPVTVNFRSKADSNEFHFDRIFNFPGKPAYHFRSKMVPQGGNEVIEFMRSGIGWRAAYVYENNRVMLQHKGYALKIFNIIIPIPVALLFGKCSAEEVVISDDSFSMNMEITHPLWGLVYEYKGIFKIVP